LRQALDGPAPVQPVDGGEALTQLFKLYAQSPQSI
jgi:hypothetical protein